MNWEVGRWKVEFLRFLAGYVFDESYFVDNIICF